MEFVPLPADMANYYRVLFTGAGDGAGAQVMETDNEDGTTDAIELKYDCPALPGGLGFQVQVVADQCSKRYATVTGATIAVGELPRYASAPALPSPGAVRAGWEEEAKAAAAKPKPAPPSPKPPPKPEPAPERKR